MPTTWSVTVGGVERDCKIGSLNIQEVANGINTARASFMSLGTAPFRPTLGAEFISVKDSVREFGGFVERASEQAAGGMNTDGNIEVLVDFVSFATIGDRRFVYETIAAGLTLKQALQQIEPYVTPYGVSLSASQVNGPTLTADIVIDGDTFNETLNRLSAVTGYLGGIDYNKSLRMVAFGEIDAPFDIADGVNQQGDIKVDRSRGKYFNRVVAKYGTAGPLVPKSDSFTGNGVLDTFSITYPVAGPFAPVATEDGAIAYGVVNYADGTTESIAGQSAPSGFLWEYDPDALTIKRRSGAVPNLVAFTFRYDVQFPRTVIVEDAAEILAHGIFETVILLPNVYDKDEATATATLALSQFLEILTTVTYTTRGQGLHPGMTQTIEIDDRDVSGEFLISEVRPVNPNDEQEMLYSVIAIDSETFRGSYRQLYKDWLSPGSKSASTGAAASGGGAPYPPDRAVQFNHAGAFWAHPDVLIDKDASGDAYASGIPSHKPARLAVFSNDYSTIWQAAFGNRAAGIAKAFILNQLDDGTQYLEHRGGDGLYFIEHIGEFAATAGKSILLTPGVASSYALKLRGLTSTQGLALGAPGNITSSPFTIDFGLSGGNPPMTVFYVNRSTAGTVNLPQLSAFNVHPETLNYRALWFVNIGTAAVTLDGDSTDPIVNGIVSALTLTVAPGQAVCLHGRSTAWYVIGSHGFGGNADGSLALLTADPASPVDDTWWAVRTGSSPTMAVAVKARIAGVTYSIGEITA